MIVTVVCTGNVARSPALAWLLAEKRMDLHVQSAAVGRHAKPGLRMRKHMRELMDEHGMGASLHADQHRSRLFTDMPAADLIIACAPVHMARLQELAPDVPRHMCLPVISDPAYAGADGYKKAWDQIKEAAVYLAWYLPGGGRV